MEEKSRKVLITGTAGFIGSHLSEFFLRQGYIVCGIDNLNSYYDVSLKNDRVSNLRKYDNFMFYQADLMHFAEMRDIVMGFQPEYIIHLAAQAGVRYSIDRPREYIDSNIIGFFNILEICRGYPELKHLLYASSSSVYGRNIKVPFSVEDQVDQPASLYAATKKSNELMAYCYSDLYSIPTTGLRFFTVYGPWGRPDMAYFSFTKNILENKEISIFNHGLMERDFTYIDDVVESIYKLTFMRSDLPMPFYQIYNIGNSKPVTLMYFVEVLEKTIGIQAKKKFLEMQSGDVVKTFADVRTLENLIGDIAHTSLEIGIGKFVQWYKDYYKIR